MLEQNQCIKAEIRDAVNGGMPCMAECGGFMYLHEEMEDMEGRFCKMAGVIPGKVFRTPGLSRFGYIMLSQQKTVLGEKDLGRIPAHEFHYFDSETCGRHQRMGLYSWNRHPDGRFSSSLLLRKPEGAGGVSEKMSGI